MSQSQLISFWASESRQPGPAFDAILGAMAAVGRAERGIVVVVPNYRLYPEVPFPVFLQDAAAAAAAVQARAG